ncbi:hypothetical protein, conserved [Babesia ovata]|uniref:C3H1-type domain-containing protein n=1 Tax=Babesia ovata TaxID=189622 RepID=A0A2H6KAE0_9APIC|nr:uncharacterized protein BOVATA_014600 [Babesia ovata]GBE59967.1 hypothetical protein, conserved [Babesia ovata]
MGMVTMMVLSLNDEIDLLKNSDKSTGNSQNDSKIDELKSQLKDHVAKYHSLSESDRTAQLKDIQSRMLSLAELSGKLGQFIGQSDAVTKAINDGIDAIIDSDPEFKSLKKSPSSTVQPPAAVSAEPIKSDELEQKIKQYNNLKSSLESKQNNQNSPLSSEESRLLSSHQSKLDALEKLSKLNESFKSLKNPQSDNCKNLLNNLCSGLEKFLGYNEHSKGYDGSGIVYSDLDRLCDGVMAFLHGVLSGVKDDDNVRTYDKNLAEPKIDKLVEELKSSIGQGSGALGPQVTAVSGWLGRYEGEVKKKCEAVSNALTAIQENITHKHIPEFNNSEGKSLKDLHEKFVFSVADVFEGLTALKANSQGYEALDNGLKGKLDVPLGKIGAAVDVMKKSAADTDFFKQVDYVDNVLMRQKDHIMRSINTEIRSVRNTLTTQFDNMIRKIGGLKKTKIEHFKTIYGMLTNAQNLMGDDFEWNYKNKIGMYFSELHNEVDAVYVALQQRKSQLLELVSEARQSFTSIKNGIGNKENNLTAKENSIYFNWGELKKKVMQNVAGLTDTAKIGKLGDLDNIVKGVKQYAEDFTTTKDTNGFETVVQRWIKEILKQEPIKGYVEKWLENVNDLKPLYRGNRNEKINDEFRGLIATKIKDHLKNAFKTTKFPSFKGEPNEKIDDNVQGIQAVCNDFAMQLSEKIVYNNINAFSSGIVDAIEKDPELIGDEKKAKHNKGYLDLVVRYALHHLAATARHVSGELNKLTIESNLSEHVRQAIKKVAEIRNEIEQAKKPGQLIDDALSNVSDTITELGKKLESDKEIDKKLGEIEKEVVDKLYEITIQKDTTKKGAIEDKKEKTDELMKQLKRELSEKLKTIREAVEDAERCLQDDINILNTAVKNAFTTSDQAVLTLKDAIIEEVRKAFLNVTNDVRVLFTNGHQADLHALKSLVSAQLAEIKSIISRDRITGPKGLLRLVKISLRSITFDHKTMRPLAVEIKKYFEDLCHYLQSQSDISDQAPQIKALHASLDAIFDKLLHHQHFHHAVSTAREAFEASLQAFHADTFPDAPKKVLQPLKQGLEKFAQELEKQYVSRYSGAAESFEWTKQHNPPTQKQEPTEKAMKCAQILLTILMTLNHDLSELYKRCHKTNGKWKEHKISLISKPSVYNPLGAFFKDCGFIVSKLEEPYDGELRCHDKMKGGHVFNKLVTTLQDATKITHLPKCVTDKKDNFDLFDLLKCLTTHVSEYYQSCHVGLPKSKKYPCSVRDICVWLAGLPHTAVYKTIDGHCNKLLNQKDEATGIRPYYDDDVLRKCLQHLNGNITKTCHLSHRLLVSIQGNGSGAEHAAYPYACCFENNHGGFYYPGDPSSLLDMLKDMCMRLLRALCFLYQRCKHTAADGNGWRECQYGYRVGTYQWDCDKASDNSSTQPKSQAKCQPNGHPNDQPNCLPKSPLQAHLMDGLPGFMPHKFTAVGCQPMCSTCPKGSLVGQCITPMGFADLATAGSITGRGEDLIDVLSDLCKNSASVLCDLVHALQCILPSPPKGLAGMFSYYCNIFQKSYGSVYGHDTEYKGKIDEAIRSSFPFETWLHNNYSAAKLTDKFRDLSCRNSSHNNQLQDESHCDLWSLSPNPTSDRAIKCNGKDTQCAPYLKSLCHDACHTYPAKHKALYLGWLCQLTWTFWDLLDQLLKAFSDISCQSYGCLCKCGFGKHGVTEEETSQPATLPKPSCHCTSIVQCKGPMSVFYQYGFTFGMPKELMASGSKKTCDSFVKQLTRVLHKGYFEELFDEIDNFIWAIRTPFSYLLLALWSLSLLYLLHIAVVRLDVLRIRSHLRSPASHRIAAQSLLAAARVKALNNVKYFSP